MHKTLLVFLQDAEDRHELLHHFRSLASIFFCASASELARELPHRPASAVLCELLPGHGPGLSQIIAARHRSETFPDVVVRCRLTRRLLHELIVSGPDEVTLRVSVKGHDSVCYGLLNDVPTNPSARFPILRRLVPSFSPYLCEVLAAAIIAGERRTRVQSVARLSGMSIRTIERRLEGEGLPCAGDLLAGSLCLHSSWRMHNLGWNIKQTSTAAGFTSPAAFGNYVRRHLGLSPGALQHHLGFEQLLSAYVRMLATGNCQGIRSGH